MLNAPLQMMLVALAGWVNEHQLAVIEYLKEENRVLWSSLAGGDCGSPMTSDAGLLRRERQSGNRLVEGVPEQASGRVARRERLGGLLNHYSREAVRIVHRLG